VTVRVTDNASSPLTDTETFTVTVNNVAPILEISGEEKAYTGVPYELSLSSSDPGDDTITSWTVDWGDGTVSPVAGNPESTTHTYDAPLPFPSDFDGDGDVDGIDALRFVLQYRQGNVGGLGDFDEDSDVDGDDLGVFASQFGRIAWDAYQVTATATDEDGIYTSNTLPVVDPPPPTPVHTEVYPPSAAPEATRVPKQEPPAFALPAHAVVWKYEVPFDSDPAFGPALGQWQARTSALRDQFKPFEYKPGSSAASRGLIDLYGDYEDEDLFGGTKVKKAKSDRRSSWVEDFVSNVDKLNDSGSPNSDIRIVLTEGDEPEEM
jgi:hypothetical protein